MLALALALPLAAATAEAGTRPSRKEAPPAARPVASSKSMLQGALKRAAAQPAPPVRAAIVVARRAAAPSLRAATPPARVAKVAVQPARAAANSAVLMTLRAAPKTSNPQRVASLLQIVATRPAVALAPAALTVRPAAVLVPARPSFGQAYGLRDTVDALELKSSVALVLDQDTNEVLFSKNAEAVLPIASLTKLMTALIVTEARQPLDEILTITEEDIDTEKGSRSRLVVGTQLSRENMLHLALMSSENRASNALGRHYPGGLSAFVAAMNRRARELGMNDTRYVEPTGLSSLNQSSARDLATLVRAAYPHRIIRELSTSLESHVDIGHRELMFRNTNGLVRSPAWEIGLQKTGYISEAGRCLVMQAQLGGRRLIMVFLDAAGKYSRIGDAERVRRWVTETLPGGRPAPAAHVEAKTTS